MKRVSYFCVLFATERTHLRESRDSPLRLRSKRTSTFSMSDKKNAPMPASSAGLLTFFNEETQGVKIRPEIILIGALVLIATSIVLNAFFR